jgi:AcrR family transcriptional regulator
VNDQSFVARATPPGDEAPAGHAATPATAGGPHARGRAGRKRSEASRLAILAAALELLTEVGYAGLTIEGIAARSGTGKQTVYRWWPSKADVLLDALMTKAEMHIPVPDEGSYAADLRGFLTASFTLGRDRRVIDIQRALMAQAQIDHEFGRRFRTEALQHRRDALTVILDRARARGDLPPGLSPGTVADIVFGVIWYRVLATHQPLDEALVDELVTTLTAWRPDPESGAATPSPADRHTPRRRKNG